MTEKLFDVVAVNIKTGAERLIAEHKTERNAEAIVAMAVMRQGVVTEFFKTRLSPHEVSPMTKDELLKELRRCQQNDDREEAHSDADTAILKFINDKEIEAAYDAVEKWYA